MDKEDTPIMIRVLIVDDSRTTRVILKNIITSDPEIEVIGEAENGLEGCEMAKKLSPDLITMDLEMPVMGGLKAVKHLMHHHPTPILVVSGAEDEGMAFKAIEYGALEVVEKPKRVKGEHYHHLKDDLIEKIKILSQVEVSSMISASQRVVQANDPLHYKILALGSSTGGPRVLAEILGALPRDFPLSVVLVQHISQSFITSFVNWLNNETPLTVQQAEDGTRLVPSRVYVAPPMYHMSVRKNKLHLEHSPPINECLPSIDVLFTSVAFQYGERAIAALLTGMGKDGAAGMKEIFAKGGFTLAQDRSSSVIHGMPGAAIEMGAVRKVLPPREIAVEILSLAQIEDRG